MPILESQYVGNLLYKTNAAAWSVQQTQEFQIRTHHCLGYRTKLVNPNIRWLFHGNLKHNKHGRIDPENCIVKCVYSTAPGKWEVHFHMEGECPHCHYYNIVGGHVES